jgi:hypothetical protein
MPNHVESKLILSGNEQELARFLQACKGEEGIEFTRPFPCPKDLETVNVPVRIVSEPEYKAALQKKNDRKEKGLPITVELSEYYRAVYGADNWYDWRLENWGTKWRPYWIAEVEGEKHAFSFCTAWSPATGLWLKLSSLYPAVAFHTDFHDEMDCFWGTATFEDGVITEDICFDHNGVQQL